MKSGRIAYAVGIIIFGLAHFPAAEKFAELVPIPGQLLWVYLTGICLVLAGISIIIKKQITLSTLLLGILLLLFVAMVHIPQAMSSDDMTKANGIAHALKTLSLAGAAFFLYGYYKGNSAQ